MHFTRHLVLLLPFISLPALPPAEVLFDVATDTFSSPPLRVCVAGSFNDWSTTATQMMLSGSRWQVWVPLADGRYYYKFVWADENGMIHWLLDPRHPYLADNGQRGANNVLDVSNENAVIPTEGMEHFYLDSFSARWVAVAGDFNDWTLGQFPLYHLHPLAKWEIWIELKRPFSYRLIRDGWWIPDSSPERWPRVPNGFGEFNSHRPADHVTSPELVVLSESVAAGDPAFLDRIEEYNKLSDYGRAVTLAREVARANEDAFSSTHPLRLSALGLEAKVHNRWARFGEAVRCWEAIVACNVSGPETQRAIEELAAYYTHVLRNSEAARHLTEQAIVRARFGTELIRIVTRHIEATFKERRYEEVVLECDLWLAAVSPPDGKDKEYACQLSEIWLYKALAHARLGQREKARLSCEELIEMHPYADSQNVQRARQLLGSIQR